MILRTKCQQLGTIKHNFLIVVIFISISIISCCFYLSYNNNYAKSYNYYLSHGNESVHDPTCKAPYMKEPTYKSLDKRYSLKCEKNKENIVSIKNGKFLIKHKSSKIECTYRSIIPVNDNKTILDNSSVIFKQDDPLPSDYFMVYCRDISSNKEIFQIQLQGIKPFPNVVINERRKIVTKPDALNYNVAVLGFDAMSRIAFMEHLPRVYDYFENVMKGVIFKKHGVIGDGSIPNLLAMITGEYVETLRKNYRTADDYPSIFNYFQQSGYITLFSEDTNPRNAVFQRGLPGFHRKPPIDHFNRPYYLHKVVRIGCLGSLPMYQLYMDLLYQMYDVYDNNVKKFPFIFQVETSHDDNRYIQAAEDDILAALKEFLPGGKFDNTILFLFSDHGARYSEKRSTLQGKYEERMPFLGIYLPEALRKERPNLLNILKGNSQRLTSPFDLYATFRDILGLLVMTTNTTRQSMSLFRAIPERSCAQAGIGVHWCTCNSYRTLNNTDIKGVSAALAVVQKINEITGKYRDLCAPVRLDYLTIVQEQIVNEKILKFKKTHEDDNYILGKVDESDGMKVQEVAYLVTFKASPGDGVFEATVRYNLPTNKFLISESDISRINAYARWIKCIGNQYMSLRKFCICKDAL